MPGATTTSSPGPATISTARLSEQGGSAAVQLLVASSPVGLACRIVAAKAGGARASTPTTASTGQIALPIWRFCHRMRRCGGGGLPKMRDTLGFRGAKKVVRVVPRSRCAGRRAGRSRRGRERLVALAARARPRGRGHRAARRRAAADDRHGGVRRAAAHVAAGARRPDRRLALPGVRAARRGRHLVPGRHGGARQHGARGPGDARRPLSAPGARVGRRTRTRRTCSRCSRATTSCTCRRRPPGCARRACACPLPEPPRAISRAASRAASAGSCAASDPTPRPALWFKHVLLPHVPWQYYPSGRSYRRFAPEPIPGLNGRARLRRCRGS